MPEKKKLGRPTDNPKTASVHVRLDSQCVEVLDKFCTQEQVARAEAIRQGIIGLKDKLKK